MTRKHQQNPALQPIKGIIIFQALSEQAARIDMLMKSLSCEVIASKQNRYTVKTSRGNMQHIKRCWLDNNPESAISRELNACVSQIIIGGAFS